MYTRDVHTFGDQITIGSSTPFFLASSTASRIVSPLPTILDCSSLSASQHSREAFDNNAVKLIGPLINCMLPPSFYPSCAQYIGPELFRQAHFSIDIICII